MKIKNLNVNKKAVAVALTGAIVLSTLVGCNKSLVDLKYSFNKAIIFEEEYATIIEIETWKDYDGEQFQIKTSDGFYMLTSSFDTKLIDDSESKVSAEDLIASLKGEDFPINYFNATAAKTK